MTSLEKFARVLKLAAIMSIALIIFVGCSKDDDKPNPGGNNTYNTTGSGQIEYLGTTYPLVNCSALSDGDSAPYTVLLTIQGSKYGSSGASFYLTSSSKSELLNVEAEEDGYHIFNIDNKSLGEDASGRLDDIQIDISKSGNNYDITINATTRKNGNPFKLTYQGTIDLAQNN